MENCMTGNALLLACCCARTDELQGHGTQNSVAKCVSQTQLVPARRCGFILQTVYMFGRKKAS
jgi:starvation-inducible outer membrane lipoprotein